MSNAFVFFETNLLQELTRRESIVTTNTPDHEPWQAQARADPWHVARRLYTGRAAAQYCGRSPKTFLSLYPGIPVIFPDGVRRWDVRDIDRWIDSLKSGESTDLDAILARLD